MDARVVAVARSATHTFSKTIDDKIQLEAGLGVAGDAHNGVTVKHRSRVKKDPTQPNLRQVHLMHEELFAELRSFGFDIAPGDLGENVTTTGVDLLGLPQGARLRIGPSAVIEVTGLRNPCVQIDAFRRGLMHAVLGKAPDGSLIRKSGVMAVVLAGGSIERGDPIMIALPEGEQRPLQPV